MSKLTCDDIRVIPAGKMIKEEILKKYNSLSEFADEINLYENSIIKYLDSKKGGSDPFKLKLVSKLGKGYDEIVIPKEVQIRSFVRNISENIGLYTDAEDLYTLEKLKKLCLKNKMEVEAAQMLRNMGMNYFYQSITYTAREMVKLAIDMLADKCRDNLILEYYSDLGLICFYDNDYTESRKAFENAETMLKYTEVSDNIKFLLKYRYGILLNNTGKQEQARTKFSEAVELAPSNYYVGKAVMNIGTTFANGKKYDFDKAIEYYKKSLEYFEADDQASMSTINNNIAEVYKLMEEYEPALEYIEKAMEYVKNSNKQKYFIYLLTFTQIKLKVSGRNDAINVLFDEIESSFELFIYRKHLIDGIKVVWQFTLDNSDIVNIIRLKDMLIKALLNEKDTEFIKEVKTLLCDILLFLHEGGTL
ncbi:MAG: tetratricopeptide repeat protein [Bacillota bacterium]